MLDSLEERMVVAFERIASALENGRVTAPVATQSVETKEPAVEVPVENLSPKEPVAKKKKEKAVEEEVPMKELPVFKDIIDLMKTELTPQKLLPKVPEVLERFDAERITEVKRKDLPAVLTALRKLIKE